MIVRSSIGSVKGKIEMSHRSSVFDRKCGQILLLASICTSGGVAQSSLCRVPVARRHPVDAPVVLYTDLQSGPASGGESNQGVYLSIFGKHFGAPLQRVSVAPSALRVFIGGHPVASYKYVGASSGRPDIEQITVQVGQLGDAPRGVALPILVEVDGKKSNTNITFMPNPGKIYFVDNVSGNDATGIPDDPAHPFRVVQTADPKLGLWSRLEPGDVVILRGRGIPWTGSGIDGFFLRFQRSGTAPRGVRGTGPITLMGYPRENVFIDETFAASPKGAIAARSAGPNRPFGDTSAPTDSDPNVCEQNSHLYCSQWIVIAGLAIEGGGKDGAVDLETGGNHWRIVNNELTARTAQASARSGGIAGDGLAVDLLGNNIHDIDSPDPGLENHGIYIDGPGSYRVEYNYIHDVPGGSGLQVYGDETPTGSFVADNVILSHNWVDHVAKYCINFADNSGRNFAAFDNVLAFCGMAGLRTNSALLEHARVFNNTFYAADSLGGIHYGAIVIDSPMNPGALEVRNNIFVPRPGMPYIGGDAALKQPDASAVFARNLYFGGTGTPGFDHSPILANPGFRHAGSCDFHVFTRSPAAHGGSPQVRSVVADDFDASVYGRGGPYALGAYQAR